LHLLRWPSPLSSLSDGRAHTSSSIHQPHCKPHPSHDPPPYPPLLFSPIALPSENRSLVRYKEIRGAYELGPVPHCVMCECARCCMEPHTHT
jgi:hypothetical protein